MVVVGADVAGLVAAGSDAGAVVVVVCSSVVVVAGSVVEVVVVVDVVVNDVLVDVVTAVCVNADAGTVSHVPDTSHHKSTQAPPPFS